MSDKYSGLLWRDMKTDADRVNFLQCGRAVETGIIAPAILHDVALAFHFRSEMMGRDMSDEETWERIADKLTKEYIAREIVLSRLEDDLVREMKRSWDWKDLCKRWVKKSGKQRVEILDLQKKVNTLERDNGSLEQYTKSLEAEVKILNGEADKIRLERDRYMNQAACGSALLEWISDNLYRHSKVDQKIREYFANFEK